MKAGKTIVFVDADRDRHEATCKEITGEGASGCKLLTVTVDGEEHEAVPYVKDRVEDEPYWQLVSDPQDPA